MALTREQRARRQFRLGASEIATILGDNPYCTPLELWAEKTGRQMDPDSIQQEFDRNKAIELGDMLEAPLLDWAERKYSKRLVRNIEYAAPGDIPIVSTLDGHWDDLSEVVETKTAGLAGWSRELLSQWDDGYPRHYYWQCQTQMYCSGIHRARLIALVAGKGILEYEIPFNAEEFLDVVKTCRDWWNQHIGMDAEPATDSEFAGIYKHIKPRTGEEVQLTDDDQDAVNWIKKSARIVKRIEDKQEQLKNSIIMSMGLATEGVLPDGRLVTFREQSRAGYTVGPKKYRQLNLPRK